MDDAVLPLRPGRNRWVLLAFVVGSLLAGANPVAIRFSNRELAPLWGATLRFSVATVVLLGAMGLMKIKFPRGRALKGAVVYGLFQFAGAFGFYYYALVHIHAGLGQTMLALVPLATLLLAVLQGQERLHIWAIAGSIVSLAGVAIISSGASRGSIPLLSLLAVGGSVLCFGEAAVAVRRFPRIHPVAMNAAGMLAASVVLAAAAALAREPMALPRRPATWVALGYVAVIGSVVVFMLYVFILQNWSASRASYVMVLVPFVTVVLSAWLDNEPIGSGLVIGGLLIIAGVYVGALRPAGKDLH